MDKRTQGILFTVLAVLFCGCPGLFLCLFGAITATGNGVFNERPMHPAVGIALMCIAVILIVIPVAVGFFTLRNKPAAAAPAPSNNEPIPPAS